MHTLPLASCLWADIVCVCGRPSLPDPPIQRRGESPSASGFLFRWIRRELGVFMEASFLCLGDVCGRPMEPGRLAEVSWGAFMGAIAFASAICLRQTLGIPA